jgi:dTMP kinase
MIRPGVFITFEGGEGAGKSTQIAMLANVLSGHGYSPVVTREPGGTPAAEAARAIILDASFQLDAMSQFLFFTAARRDHLEKRIWPALAAGQIVLCDRFVDSTRAYQTGQESLADADVISLSNATLGHYLPDLTFILDIDPRLGMQRAATRRGSGTVDAFEDRNIAFHNRVRASFLRIASVEPDRCHVIDAMRDTKVISDEIANITLAKLARAASGSI